MSDTSRRSFGQDFKLFFVRGLVVLLPTILTLWILVKAFQFVHQTIAEPINASVQWVMVKSTPHLEAFREFRPTPEQIDRRRIRLEAEERPVPSNATIATELTWEKVRHWWDTRPGNIMDFVGILVAITAIYFAGRLFGGFFGRRVYRRVERAFVSLPVVKQVYPYVKQVVDFLFGEGRPFEFKRVVLVEYPRRGVYSIGLLTGSALKSATQVVQADSVTIFIPSSPTPFTGYTITVPREEIYDLPISIDEALRFTISGGVLMPDRETLPPGVDPTKIIQPPTPGALEEGEPTGSGGGEGKGR